MSAQDIEWGWALGFFEGEGSLREKWRNGHKNRYDGCHMELSLVNTDMECLERFQRIVECGDISPRRNSSPLGRKPIWCWAVTDKEGSSEAMTLAVRMLPHLSSRRQERFAQALDIIDKQRILVDDAKHLWHEMKLAVVEHYNTTKDGYVKTGQKFGVAPGSVEHWVKGRGMTTHARNIRRLGGVLPS